MITYELAKELKDAGFPQPSHTPLSIPRLGISEVDGSFVHFPTLSELIDACGKYVVLEQTKTGWTAYHDSEPFQSPAGLSGVDTLMCLAEDGPTPEEAVARLWLALKKKCVY